MDLSDPEKVQCKYYTLYLLFLIPWEEVCEVFTVFVLIWAHYELVICLQG